MGDQPAPSGANGYRKAGPILEKMMSNNADASGKKRRLRDQEKAREAAMKKATPSTPPQDESDPTPAPQPTESKAPTDTPTPEPEKKVETAPPAETQSALEVDYKTQYRQLSSKYEKLQASHNTLKGKYNKAEKEKQELQQKLESAPATQAPDQSSGVRETEAFKRLTKEWGEQDAEDILEIARSLAGQQSQSQPEPSPSEVDETSFDDDPFFIMMDERIPGWDLKYNSNSAFVAWAQENFEPFSNASYMSLLKKAQDEVDPETAIRIFSAFDRSQVNQNTVTDPGAYVEPSNEGGGDAQTTPEAPTFEQGYLEKQQDLLRHNKISRQEFYKRREEYLKAYGEGRVKAA